MATIWPLTGLISKLDEILTISYTMHLYKNNYTPVIGSDVPDFLQADFSGYTFVSLTGWTPAAFDTIARAISHANQAQFTHNGGGVANSIYGYYVLDPGINLMWAERFTTAPITMALIGDTFGVVPYVTTRSEF